jgi:methionine transaminase
LAGFLKKRENYLELGSFLQKKRDYFQERMMQTRLEPLASHGSYFQIYSYSNISGESEKDFAIRVTEECGVASIPVAAFYRQEVNNSVLRFCFCKKESTLDAAVERLIRI